MSCVNAYIRVSLRLNENWVDFQEDVRYSNKKKRNDCAVCINIRRLLSDVRKRLIIVVLVGVVVIRNFIRL